MPEAQLRPKRQITIPASIFDAAHLAEDAVFEVRLVNGVITFTPKALKSERDDVMSYAGIFQGAWGDDATAVKDSITSLRDEWER